jgi:hypothetical protein
MLNTLTLAIQRCEEGGIQMLQNYHLSPNEGRLDNLRNRRIVKGKSSSRWAADIFQKLKTGIHQLWGRSLVSRVIV